MNAEAWLRKGDLHHGSQKEKEKKEKSFEETEKTLVLRLVLPEGRLTSGRITAEPHKPPRRRIC